LQSILTQEGRVVVDGSSYEYQYFLKDHLGNTRITFNETGTIIQEDSYYPFGMNMAGLSHESGVDLPNKFLYNGKELQDDFGLGWYDYGARFYDAQLGRWHCIDPHAENYLNWTTYNYVANNPILLVDPDGMDWFYHSTNGVSDPTWNWHDGSEYNTGVKNSDGEDVVLQGVKAVVVFEGSVDEKLGTKEKGDKGYDGKHTDGYMDGEGAKTANVTVYGPDGADDVKTYTGYTMSSDPSKYGVVNDGIYDANYDESGKSGALKSNWTLNARGRVSTYWNNPNKPNQKDNKGNYYLTGVFIHRSNNSGWAGGDVSKGCLLISPNDWKNFNNQMNGVKNFKVQVTRTTHPPYSLPQTN
jgi:RHS repeat-associated protein